MTHPNSLKNLKAFPKGVSGYAGRGGVSKLPENLRGINSLTHLEALKLISKYARMTSDEAEACKKDPKTPILDKAIISIFQTSIKHGDFRHLSFLLDRSIGKVKETLDDEETDDARAELGQLSMKELLHLVKDKLPEEPK